MMKVNPQAWALLQEDEKTALHLQYGLQKSTWEAGEIMDKSHYKYLEIKQRGEQFLKMFTEHFTAFNDAIPNGTTGSDEIKSYFRKAIQDRLKLPEIQSQLNEEFGYLTIRARELDIVDQMKKWEKSTNPYNLTLYHLIKEFDRWNNFRILPEEIREPSAFKRRNKNVYKKHIKTTCSIPDISIGKIKRLYGAQRNKPQLYMPIITESNNILLVGIRETKPASEAMTSLNLYLFKDKNDARDYITMVADYQVKEKRACIDGLNFWPKYREQIKKAINYAPIQKIVPSRKYLVMAMKKLKFL